MSPPLLREPWDLVVAHPPCTYLSKVGAPYFERPGRKEQMVRGALFFQKCLRANAPRVCVENPIMLRWAKWVIGQDYDQIVQPWQFGHAFTKAICLWLKGLPALVPTHTKKPPKGSYKTWVNGTPNNRQRGRNRSFFFSGVARAMARQWGTIANP
jgi:hypothetical protein